MLSDLFWVTLLVVAKPGFELSTPAPEHLFISTVGQEENQIEARLLEVRVSLLKLVE